MNTLIIPCASHASHDVAPEDAARIIATLIVMYAKERAGRGAINLHVMFRSRWEDELICPLEALRLSRGGVG
jgi:hypothetical protein